MKFYGHKRPEEFQNCIAQEGSHWLSSYNVIKMETQLLGHSSHTSGAKAPSGPCPSYWKVEKCGPFAPSETVLLHSAASH
jgi:hypothetical protein